MNPIGPRGVYDEAKRFAEAMTMAYHRYHGIDTKIVRIFNTYGPRMRLRDGRVVPAFIGQALAGQPLTIFGDGSQTRSFCYVSDLIDGIFRLSQSDFHEPVNIGNPREMTIKQFAEEIIRITGTKSQIEYKPLPVDDPKVRQPDIGARARNSRLGTEGRIRGGNPRDDRLFPSMARARESALKLWNVGAAFVRRKAEGTRLVHLSKIGAHMPLPHSLLAFFVRFVSNDQAMDPKIALTILPFAIANFGFARNRVSDLQLTRVVRDLPSS